MKTIGKFEAVATDITLDGSPFVAVWGDGVMLSADNGKSAMMAGNAAPCSFELESGKRYAVSVGEVGDPVSDYEDSPGYDLCPFASATIVVDTKPDNYNMITLGKAVDVANLINPAAIYSTEGDSDVFYLYVRQNVPLFKASSKEEQPCSK